MTFYKRKDGKLTTDPQDAVGQSVDTAEVEMLQLMADHEERICLIELGVEL